MRINKPLSVIRSEIKEKENDLRDQIAMRVAPALCYGPDSDVSNCPEDIAKESYEIAQALIVERRNIKNEIQ